MQSTILADRLRALAEKTDNPARLLRLANEVEMEGREIRSVDELGRLPPDVRQQVARILDTVASPPGTRRRTMPEFSQPDHFQDAPPIFPDLFSPTKNRYGTNRNDVWSERRTLRDERSSSPTRHSMDFRARSPRVDRFDPPSRREELVVKSPQKSPRVDRLSSQIELKSPPKSPRAADRSPPHRADQYVPKAFGVPDYMCAICLETVKDPQMTLAGHSYCRTCIKGALEQKPEDPLTRKPSTVNLLVADRALEKVLQSGRKWYDCPVCKRFVVDPVTSLQGATTCLKCANKNGVLLPSIAIAQVLGIPFGDVNTEKNEQRMYELTKDIVPRNIEVPTSIFIPDLPLRARSRRDIENARLVRMDVGHLDFIRPEERTPFVINAALLSEMDETIPRLTDTERTRGFIYLVLTNPAWIGRIPDEYRTEGLNSLFTLFQAPTQPRTFQSSLQEDDSEDSEIDESESEESESEDEFY